MRSYVLILILSACSLCCSAQKKYDLVKDFGAKADGRTDCYASLLKAAITLSKEKGGILNIPKGSYYIERYKISDGSTVNDIQDIIFSNCKTVVINGNGSFFRINGNFRRTSDYSQRGVPYRYSWTNTVSPFVFKNCSDILIQDLRLDGGVRSMTRDNVVVEGNGCGITIADEENDKSNRIIIKNIRADYFAADGIYIRSRGGDISVLNCSAVCNARQGLSVVAGKNVLIEKCNFDSTGFTGKYGWHAPGAGIDIENEIGAGALKDVIIRNCNIRCNKGFQIVTNLSSENVRIDSCFLADETYERSDCLNGLGMYSLRSSFTNSILFGGIQVDLADQIYTGPISQQYTGNIIYSAGRSITSSDFSRPCNISDNILVMLPSPVQNDYFPYIQNANCVFKNNIVAVQAEKIKKAPDLVTGLVQHVKGSGHNAWLLNGIDRTNRDFFTVHYYIVAISGTNISHQFFPENEKISSLKSPICKIIPEAAVNKIMSYSLFSAFSQRSFDRKWLVQAIQIRKYFAGF